MISREMKIEFIKAITEGRINKAKILKQSIENDLQKTKPCFATIICQNENGTLDYERIFLERDKWQNSYTVIERLKQYRFTEIKEGYWVKILEGCTPKF